MSNIHVLLTKDEIKAHYESVLRELVNERLKPNSLSENKDEYEFEITNYNGVNKRTTVYLTAQEYVLVDKILTKLLSDDSTVYDDDPYSRKYVNVSWRRV